MIQVKNEPGTELLWFSPSEGLRAAEAVMIKNMQARQDASTPKAGTLGGTTSRCREHPLGNGVSPRPGGEGCQAWAASCTMMAICTRLVTSSLVNRRDTCAFTVASLKNSEAPTCALEAPDPIATAT